MTEQQHPLADLRRQIDQIDDQLIALLAKRYALLADVVKIKKEHGISHRVEARVQEVLNRNEAAALKAGLPEGYAKALWHIIIEAAHAYEGRNLLT